MGKAGSLRMLAAGCCLGLLFLCSCHPKGGGGKAMTDFTSLKEVDGKPFKEGLGTMPGFLNRLKALTGKDYPVIIQHMQAGNPQGMLLDDLWYTLNADYGEGKERKQATIVADLPKNNLAAGYWQEGMGAPVWYAEQREKLPPPFRAWLEDWD